MVMDGATATAMEIVMREEQPGWPALLDSTAACEYLRQRHGIKRSAQTLAKYRCMGSGPKFRRAGNRPLYDIVHLDEYAAEVLGNGRVFSSTSEYDATSVA